MLQNALFLRYINSRIIRWTCLNGSSRDFGGALVSHVSDWILFYYFCNWSNYLQLDNSMKRSTWMWKSNFVQSNDNLVSLKSWDIQEFIFISFNFIKKIRLIFLNWIWGSSQDEKSYFSCSFWNEFQETVKLFFFLQYWLNLATSKRYMNMFEMWKRVFSLVLLDAKPGILSLCTSVTKILQKGFHIFHAARIFYFWSGF